ncbi:hypothetical protein J4558_14550 [Leptolyngbya sp. 15MV]|nr:hypothetical protein J4558_14550 [Leptolyngbya sp. 15MV]
MLASQSQSVTRMKRVSGTMLALRRRLSARVASIVFSAPFSVKRATNFSASRAMTGLFTVAETIRSELMTWICVFMKFISSSRNIAGAPIVPISVCCGSTERYISAVFTGATSRSTMCAATPSTAPTTAAAASSHL